MIPTWNPKIPGTDLYKLEFLGALNAVHKNPLMRVPSERVPLIIHVAKFGVLSTRQLGQFFNCSRSTIFRILQAAEVEPVRSYGDFDPRALELLYSIAQKYAAGHQPDTQMIATVSKYIGQTMAHRFAGVPRGVYKRYMIRTHGPTKGNQE